MLAVKSYPTYTCVAGRLSDRAVVAAVISWSIVEVVGVELFL